MKTLHHWKLKPLEIYIHFKCTKLMLDFFIYVIFKANLHKTNQRFIKFLDYFVLLKIPNDRNTTFLNKILCTESFLLPFPNGIRSELNKDHENECVFLTHGSPLGKSKNLSINLSLKRFYSFLCFSDSWYL